MNERLQAVSKRMPKIIQALAESSRANMLQIRRCSEDKARFSGSFSFTLILVSVG